jgi:hypothetical protein
VSNKNTGQAQVIINMLSKIFRKLLIEIPPSINSGGRQKREYVKKIQQWLNSIDFIKFSENDQKLYGRIFYFNHEIYGVRDIHNILKPIFDMLQGYVYENDNDILGFEGIRLDMPKKDSWFRVELDGSITDIDIALTKTCCLLEIGMLPSVESTAVKVLWL